MGRKKTLFNPDWATPPGESLREILEERGISQAALARHMGRPPKTINEIIKGKCAITAETALELEDALGTAAEFWIRREGNFRLFFARGKKRKP